MENLINILKELKKAQNALGKIVTSIETEPKQANQEDLVEMVQLGREIHEATVLVSYLAYHAEDDAETSSEQRIPGLEDFEAASQKPMTLNELPQEEPSEEEQLMDMLDQALEDTTIPPKSFSVGDLVEDFEDTIPDQEEINLALETSIHSTIQNFGHNKPQEEDNSLAAKLAGSPIQNLVTHIGINEKFLITNELFKGNTEEFLKVLQNLNDSPDLNTAKSLLQKLFGLNYK